MSISRHSHARESLFGFAIWILIACNPTFGRQSDHAHAVFDDATGRSLLSYPNDSGIDVTKIKLDLTIADMNVPKLEATETLDFYPLGWPADEIRLRSEGLRVNSVRATGYQTKFTEADGLLIISFQPPVPVGVSASVVIAFAVVEPTAHRAWTTESLAPSAHAALLNTSILESWYPRTPTNDFSTTDITIDVPYGYLACASGRLVSRNKATSRLISGGVSTSNVGPREVFRWAQDALGGGELCGRLDVVVGKFDVVDVGTSSTPVPVYAPTGRGPDARAAFASTSKMIEVFTDRFGAQYPWAKFAPIVVRQGAASHAATELESGSSMTFFTDAMLPRVSEHRDREQRLARSLAQQWFGGLVSARTPEHFWLERGFSTYAISLWLEGSKAIGGQKYAHDSLIRAWFDIAIADSMSPGRGSPYSPSVPAMVSKEYTPNMSDTERPTKLGTRGATVLHMLRQRLGDEVFFKGISRYTNRFAHRTVETIDFRHAMEEVSGESLEQFFSQWCYRSGVPVLDIKTEWVAGSKELRIDVTQTQNINADNPAFEFALPIVVPDGTPMGRVYSLDVSSRVASISLLLDAAPEFVTIDPTMSVLASMAITQPESAWIAQLLRGPTWNARVQAARSLGALNSTPARAALTEIRGLASVSDSLRAEIDRALRLPNEAGTTR